MDQNPTIANFIAIIDRFKIPLVLVLCGTFFIGLGLLLPKLNSEKKAVVVEGNSQTDPNSSKLKVDVSGAVVNPGVYKLPIDSRVEDALTAAGGFSHEADAAWVSKNINLASKVSDGQKLYIPAQGEISPVGSTLGSQQSSDKVNINFASAKELDTLPGVGQVTAEKIISLRPYNKVEDLLTKKAVGKSTFEKIKDLVSAN